MARHEIMDTSGGRKWNSDDEWALRDMIDEGLALSSIAQRLRRTPAAVKTFLQKKNMRLLRSGNVKSAAEVAQLFGVWRRSIPYWIDRGWLESRNVGTQNHPLWRISNEAIHA